MNHIVAWIYKTKRHVETDKDEWSYEKKMNPQTVRNGTTNHATNVTYKKTRRDIIELHMMNMTISRDAI